MGNVLTIVGILLVLALVIWRKHQTFSDILAVLGLYALAFAWETRLGLEPAATRILIVGLSLVLLMIFRPQGLLGKAEVRVV
ncbi:MAG: hypothetical protein R2865_16630 [Deinococcales bacterium]